VSDRTHELVVRHVEQLLVGGGLRPGDRLPSERVLAEQLGVGRPSVREALKVLEALGVVRSSPGQGRGSAAVVVARPGEAIGAAMLLTAMAEPGLEPDRFHALDAAFHVALAEAAGNAVVTVVMGALREAIQGYVLAAVERLPDWGATALGLRSEHEQLLGAVAAGDGDLAAGLMAAHIRGFLHRAGTPAAGRR
jgi:GntR family transcriptional repressor for pyruvate dehydrogenase complex